MREIDIGQTTAPLARIVEELEIGEEIALVREGQRVATLTAAPRPQRIRLGLARGKFQVPDDFDAPLPEDVLSLFYDGPIFPDEVPPTKPEP